MLKLSKHPLMRVTSLFLASVILFLAFFTHETLAYAPNATSRPVLVVNSNYDRGSYDCDAPTAHLHRLLCCVFKVDGDRFVPECAISIEWYTCSYNLQNRLSDVTVNRMEGIKTVEIDAHYVYNQGGMRVKSASTRKIDGVTSNTDRVFLLDSGLTGYDARRSQTGMISSSATWMSCGQRTSSLSRC